MKPERRDVNGIWIVTKRQGDDVELSHLQRFIRHTNAGDGVKIIRIPKIMRQVIRNQYGETLDMSIGALLKITWLPENNVTGVLGFHFANVEPGDDDGRLQYEYAKGLLGLMAATQPGAWVSHEGRFDEKEKPTN